jgi:hypothetical protein
VHRRGRFRRAGECREGEDERFSAGQVDPGARLVQQQQRVLDEKRAGEQDPLTFALGASAEGTIRQLGTAEGGEDLPPPDTIGIAGRCPPRSEDPTPTGEYDGESASAWRETVRHGMAHDPDACPDGPEITFSKA